jgi:hypothetical protein
MKRSRDKLKSKSKNEIVQGIWKKKENSNLKFLGYNKNNFNMTSPSLNYLKK